MSAEGTGSRVFNRREFLIGAVGVLAVGCTRPGELAQNIVFPTPENTPQIPEITIPPDTVVAIKDVRDNFTGKIGIDEIRVIRSSEDGDVFFFMKSDPDSFLLTPEVRSQLGLGEPLEGLLPYNKSFNLTRAMMTLEGLGPDRLGIQFPATALSKNVREALSRRVWGEENSPAVFTLFDSPNVVGTDLMYVTTTNKTRPRNSIDPTDFSTDGILKVKLRFVDKQTPRIGQST